MKDGDKGAEPLHEGGKNPVTAPSETILGPRQRFLGALATWALLAAAQPGLLRGDGFGHLAFLALTPWALSASRPGPRAALAEWGACSLGLLAWFFWMSALVVPPMVPMVLFPSVYFIVGSSVLRGLAGRVPLALATPLAWMVFELLRWFIPFPFSFGWFRLGSMSADSIWLAGSARIWGVWGISYVFAAFSGWVADLVRAWRRDESMAKLPLSVHLFGLVPVALASVLSVAFPLGEMEPGPEVLVVTPGVDAEIKAQDKDPFFERFLPSADLTVQGLASAAAEGREVDLVAWGEGMLPGMEVPKDVLLAFDQGMRQLDFAIGHSPWTRAGLAASDRFVQELVSGVLYGKRELVSPELSSYLMTYPGPCGDAWRAGKPVLPPGTAFISGVNAAVVEGANLRRLNGIRVWQDGVPGALVSKQHLVPGSEDPYPAVYVPFLARIIEAIGGYLPDYVVRDLPRVLEFADRSGRTYRVGGSVCYDQVFDDPFTTPLRQGPVDFHLVASNEAWYGRTLEMDHMVAFARLRAAMTGRSLVRATNSGASVVFDGRGRIQAELTVEGRRKQVRGTLLERVAVPVVGESASKTPYVRFEPIQLALWWILAGLAFVFSRRRVTGGGEGARGASKGSHVGSDDS
ncbi:MAG: apolipoprotein N-acyltransferase [Planctomycetota bacterium]|jgi:apolipoprotein N-acyltransferase